MIMMDCISVFQLSRLRFCRGRLWTTGSSSPSTSSAPTLVVPRTARDAARPTCGCPARTWNASVPRSVWAVATSSWHAIARETTEWATSWTGSRRWSAGKTSGTVAWDAMSSESGGDNVGAEAHYEDANGAFWLITSTSGKLTWGNERKWEHGFLSFLHLIF